MFVGYARSLSKSEAPERYFTQVCSGLTCKHLTSMARLYTDKYSSLLQKFVNYNGRKFYGIRLGQKVKLYYQWLNIS
jgi:hypothetical protein